VSNRYLKVKELVSNLASDAKMPAFVRVDDAETKPLKTRSVWLIAAPDLAALGDLPARPFWHPAGRSPSLRTWTDDYSNLIDLLRWDPQN